MRFFSIDLAKVLAITLVTGFHIWRFIGHPSYTIGEHFDLWNIFRHGYVGCDLFFVVSGFLCCYSFKKISGNLRWKNSFQFVLNRLIRIVPVYWIAVLIWVILVRHNIATKPSGWYDIVSHLFFIHTFDKSTFFSINGVFWYLGVQIHFYIIFPLLVLIEKRISIKWLFLLSWVPLVIVSIIQPTSIVYQWNCLVFMPEFVFGMLLFKAWATNYKFSNFSLSVTFIITLFLLLHTELYTSFGLSYRVVLGILLAILLIGNERKSDNTSFTEIITLLSVSSFSIYLYNYIFYTFRPIGHLRHSLIGFVSYTLLVFGFGILMYFVLEKPISKLLRK